MFASPVLIFGGRRFSTVLYWSVLFDCRVVCTVSSHVCMYVAAFLLPLSCAETKRERATAASVLSIAFAARRIYMASAGDGRCQRDAVSKACDRCKAASRDGKTCHSRRGWKWTVDLKENDALTDLPGMPLVRGVDALTAPGVRVVASFNQSNWPGILSELAPGLVRAASDQHKKQLCNVWKKEHSYQSWPVLLGCPGVRATEYEPACANVGGVVAIDCGSIDLSADPTLTGAVFDDRRWFRVTHSQGPPSVCAMKKTETLRGSIGVALSVYPTAIGHFVPEQLPICCFSMLTSPERAHPRRRGQGDSALPHASCRFWLCSGRRFDTGRSPPTARFCRQTRCTRS